MAVAFCLVVIVVIVVVDVVREVSVFGRVRHRHVRLLRLLEHRLQRHRVHLRLFGRNRLDDPRVEVRRRRRRLVVVVMVVVVVVTAPFR